MSIEETLKERGDRYGDFKGYAVLDEHFKKVYEFSGSKIEAVHQAGLDMIFGKIARILNGDPNYADNWHDIAGYATLVEKELNKLD